MRQRAKEPLKQLKSEVGMTTAEYSIGTLGAVIIAGLLFKFGMLDSEWSLAGEIKDIIQRALEPMSLLEQLRNLPKLRFR